MEIENLDITPKLGNVRNLATSTNIVFRSTLFGEEEYYIRDVNLPGMNLVSPEAWKPNSPFHTAIQLEPDTVSYNALILMFVVDENLQIWKSIVNKAKMSTVGKLNQDTDRSRAWVHIKDSNGKTKMKVTFVDCVITDIGDLDYNSGASDSEMVLSVTLLYSYFIIDEEDAPTLRK